MDKIFDNPPEWDAVRLEFKRYKLENSLTDAKIAENMGYKTVHSFRNNKAYRRVVTGIVRLWLISINQN